MGDPSDPVKNCLLEVCCGPSDAAASFAEAMVTDGVCGERDEADRIARWVYKHFDLAERGTLTAFKKSIARVAKAT
jgi:hypothetical protein